MKRSELRTALRAASRVARELEFTLIGSLEVHDLLASKLAAGRLKDLELVGALLKLRVGKALVLRRRIARFLLASERQTARRRLKAVLEELGCMHGA